jgi:hypothetical protein
MRTCKTTGRPGHWQTRREFAAIRPGVEVIEDHPHPNLTNPDGSPIIMPGNGDDVRIICEGCDERCASVAGWNAQGEHAAVQADWDRRN